MKRVSVNSNRSHFVNEESSARLKQQRLLEDYLEAQKEFVSKKKKLQIAKHKRETLLAEVSFLRRRHKYLKTQTPEIEAKQDLTGSQNSSVQRKLLAKKENHSVKEASLKNPSPVLVSSPILGDGDWDRKRNKKVVLNPLRVKNKSKNHMITEKRVGKKKISWQDQVALNV